MKHNGEMAVGYQSVWDFYLNKSHFVKVMGENVWKY
jgi:hypothetical protein